MLFFKKGESTFSGKDEQLFQKHFNVTTCNQEGAKGLQLGFFLIRQFFFLFKNIWKTDYVFIWFGDFHAFFPVLFARLFNKKSYLIIGGSDAVHIPSLNYGVYDHPVRGYITKIAIRNAHCLLPVDKSLLVTLYELVPNIRGEKVVIPIGYKATQWKKDHPKERFVLCVSHFMSWTRIKIKGLDFLMEVARRMPNEKFVLFRDMNNSKHLLNAPDNVEILSGRFTLDQLAYYYSRAKVYTQFSLTEGFPSVICEAMLSECIPVVSSAGGMSEIVGDLGYVMKDRDVDTAVKMVQMALDTEDEKIGKAAREKIKTYYTPEIRAERLLEVLSE